MLNAEVLVNSVAHPRPDRQRGAQSEIDTARGGGRLLRHAHLRPVPARPCAQRQVTRTDAVAFATNPHDFQLMLEADPVPAPRTNGKPASDGTPA